MLVTYNKTNNYVTLYKDDLTTEDELIKNRTAIMEVSVKVKKGATAGSKATMAVVPQDSEEGQPAKLFVAEAYYREDEIDTRPIETSPATASITVSENGGTIVIPQATPSAKPTATASPLTVNSPKATTQPNNLPQTGISDNPVPVLFGSLIVLLISYVAYRRYKDI